MFAFKKITFISFVLWLTLSTFALALPPVEGETPAITSILPEGEEIIEARTLHTKTFRQPGGKSAIYASMKPIHYPGADGRWSEIRTELEETTGFQDDEGNVYQYRSVENLFQTFLPGASDGWVQVRSGEHRLGFKLLHVQQKPYQRNQNRLIAQDVFSNCNLVYTIKNGGMKEEIVLRDRTGYPETFEYLLRMRNLQVTRTPENELLFTDSQGKSVFLIPKFVMYDANQISSEQIHVSLEKQGASYRLTVRPDPQWLQSPERVYPVVVDPYIISFQGDAQSFTGHYNRVFLYIPCIDPENGSLQHVDLTVGNITINLNSPLDVRNINAGVDATQPHNILVKYTAKVGNPAGTWGNNAGNHPGNVWQWLGYTAPFFKITEWNPAWTKPATLTSTRGATLVSETFNYTSVNDYPQIRSGSCTITGTATEGKGAALVEMDSGHWYYLWNSWGLDIDFRLEFQTNDVMSPEKPVIKPLPPETYTSSSTGPVRFEWSAPADKNNSGGTGSGIAGYHVQASTNASFTSGLIEADTTNIYYDFTNLALNTTYYFRVYAKDKDWNPLSMTPWENVLNKTSGVRWSEITRTKIVTAPLAGGPAKPGITNIETGNVQNNVFYIKDRNPMVFWTATGQTRAQLAVAECPAMPKTFVEYPVYASNSSSLSAQPTWNLPEGHYVIYVRAGNSTSWSPWSDGKRVQIDYTPPVISKGTEVDHIVSFYVNFSSNEPVKYQLYWGESPDSLTVISSSDNYLVYSDQAANGIEVKSVNAEKTYYYYFVCTDRAENVTTTPVYNFGNNNIVNTELFGTERYYNLLPYDLGKAGVANVNLNNGNLIVSATDFGLPGRGLLVAMSRFYNSLGNYEGFTGKGWRTNYETHLELSGQDVIIHDPDGSSHRFTYNGTGYTRPPGDYRKVINNTGGSYTVVDTSGVRQHFQLAGSIAKLQSIEDRFGNILTLTYENGSLKSVREPSGTTAHFTYWASGKLRRVDFTPLEPGQPSRYIEYGYTNSNLTNVYYSYEDPSMVTFVAYGYNPVGLLISSKVGLCLASNRAEEVNPVDYGRNQTTFSYKPLSRSVDFIKTPFVTYTNGFAGTETKEQKITFNYNGLTTTVTDSKGYVSTYTHDNRGLCLSRKSPLATMHPTYQYRSDYPVIFTYDQDFNVLTMTEKKRVYQAGNDNLADVVTEYTYDGYGNVTKVVKDKGTGTKNLVTEIQYAAPKREVKNDIAWIKDPKLNTTLYNNEYDANDKLKKLVIVAPEDYTITHEFNGYGQRITKDVKIKSTGALKYHYTYQYHPNGLLYKLINDAGTTTYDYTVYGERKNVLDANNVSSTYHYAAGSGTLLSMAAPIETGTAGQFQPFNAIPGMRMTYTYDANGNKSSEKDAKNHLTNYYYDALNRLYRVESPELAGAYFNSYYRFDANGNQLATRDYSGKGSSFFYDELNRRTKVIGSDGVTEEELVYDESGRVKVRFDAAGDKTIHYYDSVDNMVRTESYQGSTLKYTSTYEYDANGNMKKKTVPTEASALTDNAQTVVTDFTIDTLNRPTNVVVSCAANTKYNQTVEYLYEVGQLKQMKVTVPGSSSQIYDYYYDSSGRMEYLVNPTGQKMAFEYLPGGQRLKKKVYQQNGDVSPFIVTDYKYDTAYRLRNLDYQWSSYYLKLGYVYDEIDKITDNHVQYNINAPIPVNSLLSALPPEFDVPDVGSYKRPTVGSNLIGNYTNTYQYDDIGRMSESKVYGINKGMNWGLSPSTYQKWQKTSYYVLDANGNPKNKRIEVPTGSVNDVSFETVEYQTNGSNRLYSTSIDAAKDYQINPYTYDIKGSLIREKYSDGRPDSTNTYGLDGQLLESYSESKHETKTKTIDADTSESVECYSRMNKKYVYEMGGNLLKETADVTERSNPYQSWNFIRTNYYYYNHDGVMAEKHDDLTGANNKIFTRVGRELLCCNDRGSVYYYIQNNRGDVVLLVRGDGTISSIRDYDASGQMICKSPSEAVDRDPFGFTGGLDAGGGKWKLGARFYDSGKSAFIQQDRFIGDPNDPLSLNRYVYCGMDPVNFVDPTGFYLESIADGAFIAMDVNDILKNPLDGWAWGALIADIGCAITPGATGGRLAVKGIQHAVKSATEMHHLLPKAKEFAGFFAKAGLDIEKFKIPLDVATHRLKPNGVHTGVENWNKVWRDYMKNNPSASKEEILVKLAEMRKQFGI